MKRLLLAGVVAVTAALPLAQSAQAEPAAPAVPGTIAVGDGHKPFLIGHATGAQIYACEVVPGGHRWGLLAPRASLYDVNHKLLATHYGGPTWEARDGSTVVGQRDAFVTVDPTAIDWLRLSAARTAAGPDGDRLAGTTYIQRINTTGGLPPRRRGVQRGHGRQPDRGALHRRLRLLQGHRRLIHTRRLARREACGRTQPRRGCERRRSL